MIEVLIIAAMLVAAVCVGVFYANKIKSVVSDETAAMHKSLTENINLLHAKVNVALRNVPGMSPGGIGQKPPDQSQGLQQTSNP